MDNKNTEKQVDNLMNLVEKHTRTERHLEQYSHIGDKDSKDRAREKQDVREEEMDNLKNKIINKNESKIEQVHNLVDNYKKTQSYMEDNYENIKEDRLENMQYKQKNRELQIENLSKNIYEDDE